MNEKCKLIYNQRLAGYLMQKGFVLVDMRPDIYGSRRNVFFFNESPELLNAIGEYKSSKGS